MRKLRDGEVIYIGTMVKSFILKKNINGYDPTGP